MTDVVLLPAARGVCDELVATASSLHIIVNLQV